MLALLLTSVLALAAEAPKELSAEEAKTVVGCRPMVISGQGPRIENFGQSQITTEVGAERYIRTDVGSPAGKLTVLRQGKKLCEIDISHLAGIQSVFGKVLLLRFSSGGANHWDLYDYSSNCTQIGRVANKNAQKFEEAIATLPSCKK